MADLDDLEEEENQETQQVTTNVQAPENEVKEEELGENESEDMESENEEEVRFSFTRLTVERSPDRNIHSRKSYPFAEGSAVSNVYGSSFRCFDSG